MPIDEGDDERWAELPGGAGGSSSSAEGSSSDGDGDGDGRGTTGNIASLSSDGGAGTLSYNLPPSSTRTLRISHDSSQGLAARIWPSSAMLVEFIASEIKSREEEEERTTTRGGSLVGETRRGGTFSWKGASVVELGCGPGLSGIAVAALASGSRVLLTDLEGPALRLARENAAANAAEIERGGGRVGVGELRWGSDPPFSCLSTGLFEGGRVDAVIAADVIYDEALFSPLLRTLEELASGSGGFGGGGGGCGGEGGGGGGEGGGGGGCGGEGGGGGRREHEGGEDKPLGSPRPPPRILIAHVRRWKRDARFWYAARKSFDVVDVTPGTNAARGAGGDDDEDDGESPRYSSFERGALRVFELVRRERK